MWRGKGVTAIAVVGALALSQAAMAMDVVRSDNGWLEAGAMAQLLGFGQHLNDPAKDDYRVYLFLKEARLQMSGGYEGYSFDLQLALGGEDAVLAPSPGVTLSLLDADVNIPVRGLGGTFVKVGQFKVPYGREELTYSGATQFVDRSIDYLGFQVGRDVGATFNFRKDKITAIAGVFAGGGRDVPPSHYLPQSLNVPLLVARAGWGDVDDNPYVMKQNDLAVDRLRTSFNVSGLYMKDSAVGHSTVLNVKLSNKSLLLDGNWNPFIGQAPWSLGQWYQVGADAALRMPLGGGYRLAAEAQADWAGFVNDYGVLHLGGARGQVGIARESLEAAVRYAFLAPSGNFSNAGTSILGGHVMHEVTPAVTYYIRGHALKVVADMPILFNDPVIYEPKVGSYVGSELPDQTAVLAKGGTVGLQTVVEGRLMMQGQF